MVKQGEGLQLEFKRKAADPVKIMREVVAFANRRGGYLLIGVDDNGAITGLKHASEDAWVVNQTLEKYCRPAVSYTLETIKLTEKRSVLVYKIAESATKPVYLLYNLRRKIGRAYIRVADKSMQASREARKVLKARTTEKDMHLQYGQNEEAIMRCFLNNSRLGLKQFAELSGLGAEATSQAVVNLTLANVLELHPGEESDIYTMKETEALPRKNRQGWR